MRYDVPLEIGLMEFIVKGGKDKVRLLIDIYMAIKCSVLSVAMHSG